MKQVKTVQKVIEPQFVMEGAGVLLRRSFGPTRANLFDPFLLFDHFAFNDPVEGPIRGFPMHPHRGIETVTYMLEGSVSHRDSLGNSDVIAPGEVQWMTSGRGILHEEMPRRGPSGAIYGLQLWVNLPAALKMSQPRYRGIRANTIPTVEMGGAKVRVVVGEFGGVRGPITDDIAANPVYMDVVVAPGGSFEVDIPRDHTTLAYILEGGAIFDNGEQAPGALVPAVHMVTLTDGDTFAVRAAEGQDLRFMLISGKPSGEKIFPYGPFVMNTLEEIQQALIDLRDGTFVS